MAWTDEDRADRCGAYHGYAGKPPDGFFWHRHPRRGVRSAYRRAWLGGRKLRKESEQIECELYAMAVEGPEEEVFV